MDYPLSDTKFTVHLRQGETVSQLQRQALETAHFDESEGSYGNWIVIEGSKWHDLKLGEACRKMSQWDAEQMQFSKELN